MGCEGSAPRELKGAMDAAAMAQAKKHNKHYHKADATLGIIRLDYDYPPSPGDIDCAESFAYDVFYRVIPALTFEMCQEGTMTPEVRRDFIQGIKWLVDEKKVAGISGDCGFMMYYQELAREYTHKPVFMSALAQLPSLTSAFHVTEQILIFTANETTLKPMSELIKRECGVDTQQERFHIIGCEDIDGFEAVALGEKVNTAKVEPGMVRLAKESLIRYPQARAILFECTELPAYSDAIRKACGLPVFDAITNCDFFMMSFADNDRFGLNDWQRKWDGVQDHYEFGNELDQDSKRKLVNQACNKSSGSVSTHQFPDEY